MQSYNAKVKREIISKRPLNVDEIRGFLMSRKGDSLLFRNRSLARYFYISLKNVGIPSSIKILPKSCKVNFSREISSPLKRDFSLVKGSFLSMGYIYDPKVKYRLDLFDSSEKGIDVLNNILTKNGYDTRISKFKDLFRISLKRSEDIKSFLVKVGASKYFFEYEDITIFKQFKEKNIRDMNMEIANSTRQVLASDRQIFLIKKLKSKNVILSDKLKLVAEARLEFPELSITELADEISISRSALRYRLKAILDLSSRYS